MGTLAQLINYWTKQVDGTGIPPTLLDKEKVMETIAYLTAYQQAKQMLRNLAYGPRQEKAKEVS